MHSEDPDRAAILARRQRFLALALASVSAAPTSACGRPTSCLRVSGVDHPGELDPTRVECPAELGPSMSLLAGTQIRLPKGITPELLEQTSPHLVRLRSVVESVSCLDDVPGAEILFFAMTVVEDDRSKSMPALRDEVLAAFGYTAHAFYGPVIDERARTYVTMVERASVLNPPTEPARAFLVLKGNAGRMYAVIFEVYVAGWSPMDMSLRESAASLSFSSP